MAKKKDFIIELVSREIQQGSLVVKGATSKKEVRKLFKDGELDLNAIEIDGSHIEALWEIESISLQKKRLNESKIKNT